MPKKKGGKGGTSGKPAAQPRAAGPQKREAQTSPKKKTDSKRRAVDPSGSNESDGAPAPAPAAETTEPTKKCVGRCKKRLPQSAFSPRQWKQSKPKCENCKGTGGSRKPARSNEEDVPLSAKIINSKGEEKDSVPVPGDDEKRSVKVVHVVRIRRKKSDKEKGETPDDKVARAWDTWLGKGRSGGPEPPRMWNVVNAETGGKFGAYVMSMTVSVDRTNRRATVTEEKLMATLQKSQMGAINPDASRPNYGTKVKRFLSRNAEGGLKLLLKTYRDSVADVLERKCNGTALKSDKGVVVEATQGCYPSDLRRVFPDVEEDVYFLQSTIKTRGIRGRYHFVDETMEDAQAKCLRQVSTSAWKCAFNLTRPATPSTRLLDGVCSMAWTRDSPFDVPRRT